MPAEPSKALTGPATVRMFDAYSFMRPPVDQMRGRVLGLMGWPADWTPTVPSTGTVTNPTPGQIVVVAGGGGTWQWDGTKWVPYTPPRSWRVVNLAPVQDPPAVDRGAAMMARLVTFPAVYKEYGQTTVITRQRPTAGQLYPLGDR